MATTTTIRKQAPKRRSYVARAMILEARSTRVPNKRRQASREACRRYRGEA